MATKKAPWQKKNPAGPGQHKTLTPTEKAQARRAAKDAGRSYPNLIDNMRVASKKTAKKKTARKP